MFWHQVHGALLFIAHNQSSPTENKTISNANYIAMLFSIDEVKTTMLVHNKFLSNVRILIGDPMVHQSESSM